MGLRVTTFSQKSKNYKAAQLLVVFCLVLMPWASYGSQKAPSAIPSGCGAALGQKKYDADLVDFLDLPYSSKLLDFFSLLSEKKDLIDELTQRGKGSGLFNENVSQERSILDLFSGLPIDQILNRKNVLSLKEDILERAKEEPLKDEDEEWMVLIQNELIILNPKLENARRDFLSRVKKFLFRGESKIYLEIGRPENLPYRLAPFEITKTFEMYRDFAESQGWKVETVSMTVDQSHSEWVRHAVLSIEGPNVSAWFRFERGIFKFITPSRIQSSSRKAERETVHTNYVQVRVISEVQGDFQTVEDSDIKITHESASGPGGQNVNKGQAAVRAVHEPTNIAVFIQNERSATMNEKIARAILKEKVLERQREDAETQRSKARDSGGGREDDQNLAVRVYYLRNSSVPKPSELMDLILQTRESIIEKVINEEIERLRIEIADLKNELQR